MRKNGFYERNLLTRWGKQGSQDKGRGLLPKPIKALLPCTWRTSSLNYTPGE